jgi:hypothetical protein
MLTTGTGYIYSYALLSNDPDPVIIDTSSVMHYSDEKINASFAIGTTSIQFKIENKTGSPMKILWDEASIVKDGTSMKIMHTGIKYTDRNMSQPPTVIPPYAAVEDMAVPTENVYYKEGYYGQYYSSPGGWKERDLFPLLDYNDAAIKQAILNSKDKIFSLFLPIQTEEKTLNYNFRFIITAVTPRS